MTLHRDIFWLGRQWAVTGLGVQAVDRKLGREFDVEASRIFEHDLASRMAMLEWFDAEDFAEAVRMARERLPERPLTFRPMAGGER